MFSVQSTYKALTQEINGNTVSKEDQKFWLKIWHLKLPYKLNLFLWRCLKEILQTRGIIGRYCHLDDYNCPLCAQTMETDAHLLMQCDLAKAVWFAILPEAMHSQKNFNS